MQDPKVNSSLISQKLLTIEKTIEKLNHFLVNLQNLSIELAEIKKINW